MVQLINRKFGNTEIVYLMIFIAGIILSVVSLFLPWETVRIDENGFYQYLPFSGWIIYSYNVYDDMPVDISYLLPMFIFLLIYSGVVIPMVMYVGNRRISLKGNYYSIKNFLLYFGPILMCGILFLFSLALIVNHYWLPYITIYIEYESVQRLFSYAMGEGMLVGLLSIIFTSFGASMLHIQTDGLPPKQITGSIKVASSTQMMDSTDTTAINQTQHEIEEEYQQVEDQFAHALYSKIITRKQAKRITQREDDSKENFETNHGKKEDKKPDEPMHGGDMHELEL